MPRRDRSLLSHRTACRGDKRITTFDTQFRSYGSLSMVERNVCYNEPVHHGVCPRTQQKAASPWQRNQPALSVLRRHSSHRLYIPPMMTFKLDRPRSSPTYMVSGGGQSVLPLRLVVSGALQTRIEHRTRRSGGMRALFGEISAKCNCNAVTDMYTG
jgi:hypothetical protein